MQNILRKKEREETVRIPIDIKRLLMVNALSFVKLKIFVVFIILSCVVVLNGCAVIDNATEFASEKTKENTELIDDYLNGEDVDLDIKFDTPSASDVINGEYDPTAENYYDEKSGEYVSKAQYKANNLVDSLKTFWIPVCVISIFIGFMIRRINHSSATLRKIGLFLEVVFPLLLTLLVYIASALADSSVINVFDNLF